MERKKLVWWSVAGGVALAVGMFSLAPEPPRAVPVSRPPLATAEERAEARAKAATRNKVRLPESIPPVGKDQMLSHGQIVYCLAEEIRIEGARAILKNASDQERFNNFAKDFNSRCGAFRYRVTDYDAAKREVNAISGQLRRDGAARFDEGQQSKPVEKAK
jgi:hypothetical protein